MTGEWISQTGAMRRRAPVSLNLDDVVDVVFRDGSTGQGKVASWNWACTFGDKDIMRYRIVSSEETQRRLIPGRGYI